MLSRNINLTKLLHLNNHGSGLYLASLEKHKPLTPWNFPNTDSDIV